MNQRIPSLSEGLHQTEPQIENNPSATEEMSEREKIHYEYGMQRDMSKVTYFPAKKAPGLNDLAGRLRVVVYCRVSTDGLSQATSFELQRSYYLRFVRKHIQWKLIAMYSDEGITATSTEKRIGLLQMLEDAKAGKFDVIIVKNLSRLSRNLMDCMNIIYALRNLPNPVGIYFESENLYTLDKSADFTLQVLSLVAQEESHKKSEAMLASYYMRFSQGQYLVPDLLGYRKVGKNKIAIDVEEAKTVQLIFMMFMAGYSPKTIAGVLTKLGRKTHTHVTNAGVVKKGVVKWTAESVMNILKNERRCGDVLAQKTVTESYLTHKSKPNNDILPQFYAIDQHRGIVSPEDFLLTQQLIAANKGGWEGDLPNMHIISNGALKGFVTVVPRWCGYNSEDYNRASLRAYGVEESELVRLGGVVEIDIANRGQQVMGKAGLKATETETIQYRTSIDSDDYALYPETADVQENCEEEEQMAAFAEQVRKRQKALAEIAVDKRAYGPYDLTGCERVTAELFSTNDKVCFTIDKNGILFNAFARKKLGGSEDAIRNVEIAYNPILQMMVIRCAEDKNEHTLNWVSERENKLTMRKCPCRGFSNALFDNMGWNLDYKYKLIGASMIIDGQPVLVFTLDDPIRIVPIVMEKKTSEQVGRRTNNRQTKVLLEAGFAPEDFQIPSAVSEIDLGNDTLNEKVRNAAKSRAIYFDNITSASGEIRVADLGAEKYDPECIRQIIQKNRAPEEGWSYLKGMAVIRKNSFIILSETLVDSFGAEVYSTRAPKRLEGAIEAGTPYGWVQALSLPSRETVEATIQMLYEEMQAG